MRKPQACALLWLCDCKPHIKRPRRYGQLRRCMGELRFLRILRRTPGVGMPVCDRALAGGAALRSSTAAIIAIAAKNATRERE
jgi:hypothetical protein